MSFGMNSSSSKMLGVSSDVGITGITLTYGGGGGTLDSSFNSSSRL